MKSKPSKAKQNDRKLKEKPKLKPSEQETTCKTIRSPSVVILTHVLSSSS